MADDRGPRPFFPRDRGMVGAGPRGAHAGPPRPGMAPRPPFVPRPSSPPAEASTVRLRDGDREVEVRGSPMFCRQLLDDLPTLIAQLTAEPGASRPTRPTIALPPPTAVTPPAPPVQAPESPTPIPGASGTRNVGGNGAGEAGALDGEVLAVLRGASAPIGIADIRARLGAGVSGQAVRRSLERNGSQVVSTGGKPAAYRIR